MRPVHTYFTDLGCKLYHTVFPSTYSWKLILMELLLHKTLLSVDRPGSIDNLYRYNNYTAYCITGRLYGDESLSSWDPV